MRAGLAVIEAVGRLPAREDLRVRLGIATGLAVVGDLIGEGAAQERGVVGETPNLAARLQALAMPNTLVIAEATRRQIGGLFDLADLGPQALAGFAEPQPAWRVLARAAMLSRFEALRSGETPLVGREEEIELLVRRWQQAKSGEGRVVLISGEPGIGKSRLTAALSEHIEAEPHTRLRYFCSPHHQDSALYPVHRPARTRRRFRARRRTRDKTRQVGDAARTGGRGRRHLPAGGAVVVARRRSFRAARAEPAAQKGAHLCGVAAAARRAGPNATGADDLRGSALDRSDLARAPRPRSRADRPPAGPAGRHLPSRVPAALGGPAACDGDRR